MGLFLASGLIAAWPPGAAADPSGRARLVYHRAAGAESCPTELALRSDVFSLLRFDPFDDAADERLECDIEPDDDGFSAELRFVDSTGAVVGRRTLRSEGSDCTELGGALGLTLAMLMKRPHELFVAPTAEPAPPPVVLTATPTRPEERAPPPPPPSPRPPIVPFAVAGAGAALDSGVRVGGSVQLGGGLRRRAYSIELGLRLDSGDSAQITANSSVSASSGALVAAPCYHRSQWAACGLVSAGWVRGRGHNLEMSRAAISPQLGIGGRVAWSVPARPNLFLRVSLEAEMAVSRTILLVDDAPAWRSAAAQLGLGLAAVAQFP